MSGNESPITTEVEWFHILQYAQASLLRSRNHATKMMLASKDTGCIEQ
jgi:hypothetical protein